MLQPCEVKQEEDSIAGQDEALNMNEDEAPSGSGGSSAGSATLPTLLQPWEVKQEEDSIAGQEEAWKKYKADQLLEKNDRPKLQAQCQEPHAPKKSHGSCVDTLHHTSTVEDATGVSDEAISLLFKQGLTLRQVMKKVMPPYKEYREICFGNFIKDVGPCTCSKCEASR